MDILTVLYATIPNCSLHLPISVQKTQTTQHLAQDRSIFFTWKKYFHIRPVSEGCGKLKQDNQWSKRCKEWFQWNANVVCIMMGELCKCKWNARNWAGPCPLLLQRSLIHNNPDFIVLHRWSNEMNCMWKRSPWQQESLFEKLGVWRLCPGLINASPSRESLYYETLYIHERVNWIIIDNVDELVEEPGIWELDIRDWSIQGFMT